VDDTHMSTYTQAHGERRLPGNWSVGVLVKVLDDTPVVTSVLCSLPTVIKQKWKRKKKEIFMASRYDTV
jgi:hypothetical protein